MVTTVDSRPEVIINMGEKPNPDPTREIIVATARDGSGRVIRYFLDPIEIVDRLTKFQVWARVEKFEKLLKLNDDARKLDELDRNTREGAEGVFAVDADTGRDLGVLVHKIESRSSWESTLTLDMVALRVVEDKAQQFGIGTRFSRHVLSGHDEIDGSSGRTPNPYIFLAYRHMPEMGTIYPIDKVYPDSLQRVMGLFLYPYTAGVNPLTGRCKEVYPPGEFRLYTLDETNADLVEIRNRIIRPQNEGGLGIDLEAGDGVRYVVMRKGRERWTRRASSLLTPSAGIPILPNPIITAAA